MDRGEICELCGRRAKPIPRTGKQRRRHKCPHGEWCVRGHRLNGRHANHPSCGECRRQECSDHGDAMEVSL